jgi:hypothetical protein
MSIELHTKLLKLKAILNKINDTSYGYSQLSKQFPYSTAKTDEELEKIIIAYDGLILDLINYLQTTNYGQSRLDKNS